MLIGGRIVSELINAPANRELRQLLVLLGRIYVRHIKMELAAEACNFNIHTSSRPSNYGLFMALGCWKLLLLLLYTMSPLLYPRHLLRT